MDTEFEFDKPTAAGAQKSDLESYKGILEGMGLSAKQLKQFSEAAGKRQKCK